MSRASQVAISVAMAKAEILADMADEIVPSTVTSFGDLHDFVDANEYGGLCLRFGSSAFATHEDWSAFCEEVQEEVHAWLASRSTLVITATVSAPDLATFLAEDPQILECLRARLNEVFGDNGAVLSTVDVVDVVIR